MSQILRLPPSGPPLGHIAVMPLRQAEKVSVPADPVVLTGTPAEPNAALTVSLAGPFQPDHLFGALVEIDCSNASTEQAAEVTLSLQVRYDGGNWTTVHSAVRDIGANSSGVLREIRRTSLHFIPSALSEWANPAATAALMEVRVLATMNQGTASAIKVEPYAQFIRLTEYSADYDEATALRLSPSGPDVGGVSLLALRVNEEDRVRGSDLVLTGTPQDVSASLWCELSGPFDPTHYFSAECEIDAYNESTSTLAVVTFTLQVSTDGVVFNDVWTETHDIGANDLDDLRQVRPIALHCPPIPFSSWAPVAVSTVQMRARIVASMTGETGQVGIEGGSEMWLRLVEHSAL